MQAQFLLNKLWKELRMMGILCPPSYQVCLLAKDDVLTVYMH